MDSDYCEWCEQAPPVTNKANLSVCQSCADDLTQCERCGHGLIQAEGFASNDPRIRFDGLVCEGCAYPEGS